jgi:transcriptional regulator GlxA family with amidase domain
MGVPGMGAKPQPDDRVVRSGKIVAAAGVSSGIDLALWLASQIVGRERAEAIQLTIEYDPVAASMRSDCWLT